MIRLDELVPSVYVNESRDFQFISRLYTLLQNSVKGDIDTLKGIYSPFEINNRLLPLLANFMGFYPSIDIDDRSMRYILANFPLMIKNKGNKKGIKLAVETLLQIENITNANISIEFHSEKNFACEISIYYASSGKINNFVLLNELLSYVLPVGTRYSIGTYRQQEQSAEIIDIIQDFIEKQKISYSSSQILSGVFNSIPQRNGIITQEEYSDGKYAYGTPVIGRIKKSYLAFSSSNTFRLTTKNGNKNWDGIIEYSTDTINWQEWDGISTLNSANNGVSENLYLRGINNTYITGNTYNAGWVLAPNNRSIECLGNIETLLDYQSVENGVHPPMADYCYSGMFDNCTALITAPELLATTLSMSCYSNMFSFCSNLITSMALPAMTLTRGCYSQMFLNCSKLENLPMIYATVFDYRSCYSMFSGCHKIKLSETQVDEYVNEYRIPMSGTGDDTYNNALVDMFYDTNGTFEGTPSMNTVYYTSNNLI